VGNTKLEDDFEKLCAGEAMGLLPTPEDAALLASLL